MTNKEVNDYLDNSREDYEFWAKHYGLKYTGAVDKLVSYVFEDACNFTYKKALDEFGGKDINAIMHQLMIDNIIAAIRNLGKEEVELEECIHARAGVKRLPSGVYIPDSGMIRRISINDEHLVMEIPEIGFVMQNELTVLELMQIYRYIPYK